MASSSLLKDAFHNSVAEGIYSEIVTRNTNYYYFLGKTLSWENEFAPETPVDNIKYENSVRSEIITAKQIKPTDVGFVVPRYDWVYGEVYDQYDDQYDTKIKGINLKTGGDGYISAPNVYVGSTNSVTWNAGVSYTVGQLIKSGANYYIVITAGISGSTAPTHQSFLSAVNGTCVLEHVSVSDGGGFGATATATVVGGQVIDIQLTNPGDGYTSQPSVIIRGTYGSGASATATITRGSVTLSQKLENAKFYVMTDDYNVYKCLDNNNGGASTVKPFGTPIEPVKTSDGYIWKFLYNVPVALRNKFLSNVYLPVMNALQNQYYSNGKINTVRIDSMGSGYLSANINVQGDGYLEANPQYITGFNLTDSGSGYTNPTLVIESPFTTVSDWESSTGVIIGQKLSYANNIYQVEVAGVTGVTPPTHRYDSVANGSTMLRYIGTNASGTAVLGTGANAGKVVNIVLNGSIREVNITSNGSGYTTTPTVSFIGGGGSGATALATLRDGKVFDVYVTDPGVNYTSVPTIKIGREWSSAGEVVVGEQIYQSGHLYTVSSSSVQLRVENSYYINKSVSVTTRDTAPSGLFFSADGLKMFVAGDTGNNIVAYNLTTAWDVATAVFVNESGTSVETSPTGVYFNNSGTKMYVIGTLNDNVYEYTLTTAWTLPATLPTPVLFSISAQDATAAGIAFNSTGTKMYIVGSTTDAVYEYNLGTAWTISSAVYNTSFNISTQSLTATDITFSSDGKDMLIVDSGTDFVYQYKLSTPWSISTAVYYNSFYIAAQEGTSSGIFLESSNNYLYIVGSGNDTVYQYRIPRISKLGTTAPTHVYGDSVNGDVTLTYAGESATASAALKYGAGYKNPPYALITDVTGTGAKVVINTSKSEARLQPVIDNGQIVGVNILDGGIGYTFASLTIDGTGTGVGGAPISEAAISADLSYGDIYSLQSNIELLTVDGQIANISVVSGGYGYGGSVVTIEGDGTGATATATIVNGSITKINMTNFGSGYRWAKVTISGDGYGASARAIISPYGGHGKNALNELHARTLMFYSNVSLDKNQGLDVNNDYRQVGIIKAPRRYGSQNYLSSTIASACWAISGTINTTQFPPDSIVYDTNGYRFRIVTNTGTSALIQSLDNIPPMLSSALSNDSGQTFNISQVTPPTIDKYSGDMLFIDNKLAFTPSAEQTVTLRTVIKF